MNWLDNTPEPEYVPDEVKEKKLKALIEKGRQHFEGQLAEFTSNPELQERLFRVMMVGPQGVMADPLFAANCVGLFGILISQRKQEAERMEQEINLDA